MTLTNAASDTAKGLPSRWLRRGAALAAALVAFAVFLGVAFPYPDWLDSPELATAAATLGLFHPPGSPLAVLIGYLVALVPTSWAGISNYRLQIFSPLFAAAAIYGVARIAADSWSAAEGDRDTPSSRRAPTIGLALAVVVALTPAMLTQAARLEVYTLALALAVVTLYSATKLTRDVPETTPVEVSRLWARAMFATGAGLAVHPLIALAAAAALLPALPRLWRVVGRDLSASTRPHAVLIARSAGYGFAGSCWLLLIPLMVRGLRDHRWGEVTTLKGWLEFVSGAAFAKSFAASATGTSSSVALTLALVAEGAGIGLVFGGVVGLVLLFRRRPKVALVYAAALAADLMLLMTQKNVYLSNPDATGYVLLAVVVLALSAVEGLASLASEVKTHTQLRALAGVALALAFAAIGISASNRSQYDSHSCDVGVRFATAQLRGLPRDATVRLRDFNLLFMFEYLQLAVGERPDVHVSFERDPVPTSDATASAQDLWVDTGPMLLQEMQRNPTESWRRAGVLWSRAPAGASSPAVIAAGVPTPGEAVWSAQCHSGATDVRTADVLLWHAFWSSRVAIQSGDTPSSVAFATTALCAAPEDEAVIGLASSVGLDASICGSTKAPERVTTLLPSVPAPPSSPATPWAALLLACGLTTWGIGGLWPRGRRDAILLVAGGLLAVLGLYIF